MTMNVRSMTAMALVALSSCAFAQTNFFDGFDSAGASSNYTQLLSNTTSTDAAAEFGFSYEGVLDYANAALGKPDILMAAGLGLKLSANDLGAAGGGTTDAITLYRNGYSATGTLTMRFYMYGRFLDDSVSTEYAMFGFHHSTQTGTWNSIGVPASSGIWGSASVDGGTARDYRIYEAGVENTTVANYLGASQNNATAGWQALFPDLDGAAVLNDAGQTGNQWIQVQLSFDALTNRVTWKLKKLGDPTWTTGFTVIDATPTQTTGTVQLGYVDPFASTSLADSFLVIDNLEVVERESMVLPRSVTIDTGTLLFGNLASLYNSDNQRLALISDENQPDAQVEIRSISPIAGVTSFGFTAELTSVRDDLSTFIRAWNFSTSQWDDLDFSVSSTSDQVRTATVSSGASQYVDVTTREMRAQIQFIPAADLDAGDGWSESIDQFVFDIS